jgi:transcriptional regulator with XRE-family HTH domain
MPPPVMNRDRSDKVRHVMRELLRTRFDTVTQLAEALGRSQSSISQILSGRNTPSYETAERVAALNGHSVEELWDARTGEKESTWLDQRPNLRDALALARARKVEEHALRVVVQAGAHLPDLALSTWLAMFADVERALESASRSRVRGA